ncbi:MAG: SPFH domain-containing protein, partial [bacterium]
YRIPFMMKRRLRVNMREQFCDFAPSSVITKDNVSMKIDSVVYYKIFDAKRYAYGIDHPIGALENLSITVLRNIIGGLLLNETLTSRDKINEDMNVELAKQTQPWGIKVTRVEIKNIMPPPDIQEAMEKQAKAERESIRMTTEAEAHRKAVVTRAKGDREAKLLQAEADKLSEIQLAEGRAQSIRLVYEAESEGLKMLKEAEADQSVLRLKALSSLKDVADGRATKIYMPTDLTNVISSLGLVGESLGDRLPIEHLPENAEKNTSEVGQDTHTSILGPDYLHRNIEPPAESV